MLILDRLDEQIAHVSADSGMLSIDRSLLSPDASEGDVLCVKGDLYVKDEEATQARRAHIRKLLRDRLNLRT